MAMKPGPKAKIPRCHPERKHIARDLCEKCYRQEPDQKIKKHLAYISDKRTILHRSQAVYQSSKAAKIAYIREQYHKYKGLVFSHYGKACACCGETEMLFLTIDHVNRDGKQHRAKQGNQLNVLRDIVKSGFPVSFRILCFNCNSGRQLNGGRCPHERGVKTLGIKQIAA